jgi:hypothetical protein
MFSWVGKRIAKGAIVTAEKKALVICEKILDIIKAPSEKALAAWEGLTPEDRELFKRAALSAARLTAKAIVAADKGTSHKVEF